MGFIQYASMDTTYQNDLTEGKNAVVFYYIYATRALFSRMWCACLLVSKLVRRFIDHVYCNALPELPEYLISQLILVF